MIRCVFILAAILSLAACSDPVVGTAGDGLPEIGAWVKVKDGSLACPDWATIREISGQYFRNLRDADATAFIRQRSCFLTHSGIGATNVVVTNRFFRLGYIRVRPDGSIDNFWIELSALDDNKCGQPAGHGMSYPECEPPHKSKTIPDTP